MEHAIATWPTARLIAETADSQKTRCALVTILGHTFRWRRTKLLQSLEWQFVWVAEFHEGNPSSLPISIPVV